VKSEERRCEEEEGKITRKKTDTVNKKKEKRVK
jgi:hypothetical protein